MNILAKSHGKGGIVQSETVFSIATLAMIVLLFVLTKPYISVVNAHGLIEGCRQSVALSSWQLTKDFWVIDYTFFDSPFRLNCKTIFNEVTKESINRANDKVPLKEDSEERKNQLKELIMSNMKDCWYMYGEGKAKVQHVIDAEGTACIVCSEIILTDKEVKESYTLDNMYDYAASNKPPREDATYIEYFMKNIPDQKRPSPVSKDPDGYNDKSINLDAQHRQYSIIFALALQQKRLGAFWGGGGSIEPNTGIIGCSVNENGDTKRAENKDADAIGCNSKGENPGLIFGKVIDGGTDTDLFEWKNLVPGVGGAKKLISYPATVRLIPTSELENNCERLY